MQRTATIEVLGPWSLTTSKQFWEGFAPAALEAHSEGDTIQSTFSCDSDWQRVDAEVTQHGSTARIAVEGDGDLDAAVAQVSRFLSLDIDARDWPAVGERDPVMAEAQAALPGLRPCGFHSPYEAAAWAVLSQRIRITQAAKLRAELTRELGGGVFPTPAVLRAADLDLPGRKTEYLHAVAEAALDGVLDGAALRSIDPEDAIARVQQITGIGPFAADLIVIRGANAPDVSRLGDARLEAEITERYGPGESVQSVAEAWRPFRSWGAVHLRVLREQRTREIERGR